MVIYNTLHSLLLQILRENKTVTFGFKCPLRARTLLLIPTKMTLGIET